MSVLLNKFQSVTIQNDIRISEIDRAFCEKQEKMYKEAIQAMQQTLELFKNIYATYPENDNYDYYSKGYIDDYKDIKHIEDRMNDFKNNFINKVLRHFEKAYNVTLESAEIIKKYDLDITYNNIIDEIFEQLGGFNFNEKAIQEIKDRLKNSIRNNNVSVNKNKVSINNFIYIDHFDKKWGRVRLSYGSKETINKLFNALSLFETGETENTFYYNSLLKKLENDDPFYKHEIGYNSVQSIRPYQNGKIEIVFKTSEQAQQFKNEYLTH